MSWIGDSARRLFRRLPRVGSLARESAAAGYPLYRWADNTDVLNAEADKRPLLLLVDDERVFVDTFAMIFDQSGYRSLKAYSGEQALALFEQVRPDLVFADIVMGPVNGVDVALAAKRRWPDCPVLLTTCHPDNLRLLEPARAAGYDFEVVGRPMHPKDMIALIASRLAGPPSPASGS